MSGARTASGRRRGGRARRRARYAVALGSLSLAACDVGHPGRVTTPADSAAGEVAFRLVGPNEAALVVPVELNGQGPYDFILDTGATFTCVADSTAARLQLPERRLVGGIGVGVGGAGRLRLATVDSLRIGNARAFDVPVCLLDLSHTRLLGTRIDGLLGLNVLKEFRVTLDFDRNVVRLAE
ncbi:MAG TPA: retropepsin-like aspartic protease [Gemmatimonadaceae bacterium]|nr:retropepsin-like aspartic protease [Gemmatimonadaceae bacterium]